MTDLANMNKEQFRVWLMKMDKIKYHPKDCDCKDCKEANER